MQQEKKEHSKSNQLEIVAWKIETKGDSANVPSTMKSIMKINS